MEDRSQRQMGTLARDVGGRERIVEMRVRHQKET